MKSKKDTVNLEEIKRLLEAALIVVSIGTNVVNIHKLLIRLDNLTKNK